MTSSKTLNCLSCLLCWRTRSRKRVILIEKFQTNDDEDSEQTIPITVSPPSSFGNLSRTFVPKQSSSVMYLSERNKITNNNTIKLRNSLNMSRIRGERRIQPLEIIESQEDPSVLFDVKEITDHPGRVPINFKRSPIINLSDDEDSCDGRSTFIESVNQRNLKFPASDDEEDWKFPENPSLDINFNRTDSKKTLSGKKKRVCLSIYNGDQLIQVSPSDDDDLIRPTSSEKRIVQEIRQPPKETIQEISTFKPKSIGQPSKKSEFALNHKAFASDNVVWKFSNNFYREVDNELEFPNRNNLFTYSFDHIKSKEQLPEYIPKPRNVLIDKISNNRDGPYDEPEFKDTKIISVKSAEEVQMSPVEDFNFFSVDDDFSNEEDWENEFNDDDSVASTSSSLVKNALQSGSMDSNDPFGLKSSEDSDAEYTIYPTPTKDLNFKPNPFVPIPIIKIYLDKSGNEEDSDVRIVEIKDEDSNESEMSSIISNIDIESFQADPVEEPAKKSISKKPLLPSLFSATEKAKIEANRRRAKQIKKGIRSRKLEREREGEGNMLEVGKKRSKPKS